MWLVARRCPSLVYCASVVLLLSAGLSCSGDQAANAPAGQRVQPVREADSASPAAQQPAPPSDLLRLVVDAFYRNNPVTYQPEPADVTAARQQRARDQIMQLAPEQVQEIGKLLHDSNGTVTECAAKSLELLGERASPAKLDLIAALDLRGSEHYRARAASIRTLSKLGDAGAEVRAKLEKHLNHSDSRDREAAKEALALLKANDPSAPGSALRPLLLQLAQPGDLKQKRSVVQQIDAYDKDKLVPDLIHLLKSDPNPIVRSMVPGRLSGASEAVPALRLGLGDEDESVRKNCAEALGKLGAAAKSAVPDLIEQMQTADDFRRSTYIEALGRIGPDALEAVPTLMSYLSEEVAQRSFMVYEASITALGGIGPPAKDAVPRLVELLEQETPYRQKRIVEALGKIGPAAAAAVPALQKLQDHFVVADAAIAALRQIQPDEDPLVAGPADDPADKDTPADPAQAVERAKLFFETLRSGKLPNVRALLTTKARPNYATGAVGSMTINVPDEAELTFGEPTFKNDAVAVPVTVHVQEFEAQSHLYLRSEYGQWRVYAYRIPENGGGTVMIDLENKDGSLGELLGSGSRPNRATLSEKDQSPADPQAASAANGATAEDSLAAESDSNSPPSREVRPGLSAEFPTDIPLFPAAHIIADSAKPIRRDLVELYSEVPLAEIRAFYKEQLATNGWEIKKDELMADACHLIAGKPARFVWVTVKEQGSGWRIRLTELRKAPN